MDNQISTAPLHRTNIVALLREHGINPTQQRIKIGEVLFARAQHVSAEQLLGTVRECGEEVSKATIYNTLGLFAERGLLREVIVDSTKVFYDTNVSRHHHIYHVDSGQLEDIDANQIHISQLPQLPADTTLEEIDVILRVRSTSEQ